MRLLCLRSFLFLGIACSGSAAFGQNSLSYLNDTGSTPYGVNIPVENGFIDISNGNLHLEFPLATHPQRGALALNEKLVYDSRIWMFSSFGSNYHWWPNNVFGSSNSAAGWRFVTGNETGTISYGALDSIRSLITWTDPNGTAHPSNALLYVSGNTQQITGGYATDGSGYFVKDDGIGNPLVIDANGTQVYPHVADRYGNYWSADGQGNLIDDTGRVPVITTFDGNYTYYDVLAPNGTTHGAEPGLRVRYTVTTAMVAAETNFGQSGIYEWYGGYTDPQTGTWWPSYLSPVQSIILPDLSRYTFGYNANGELSSMTLPTGGVIQYQYTNFLDSSNTENSWLSSRTVGTNPPMLFTPSVVTTCARFRYSCIEQVNLHKPSGDESVYQLTLMNGAWNTDITSYTGSAVNGQKLVQATNFNTYTNGCISIPGCAGANYISKSLSTTSLFATGSQPPIYKQTQFLFNQLGAKPTAVKEWDYQASVDTANPPTTTPARETDYTYTGNDVHTVTVLDANGYQAGQTTYAYASTAAVTSGVSQHGSQNAGGPYLQSESHWLNTGSASTVTSTMDDTGQVVGGQDADLHPGTVISYQCSNSLPYQVSNALNQTTTSVYDCNSGAIKSVADPNDTAATRAGTTYTYEPAAGRIQMVTSPDTGTTTYTYPSATEVDTSVAASPDPSISSADFLDGFGRKYQHSQDGNTSETTYDASGRPYCVTNPHVVGASTVSTCVTSFDGLDRPLSQQQADGTSTLQWSYSQNSETSTDENGNQMQRTSDAFGHLKSVSEILSGSSYTSNYTYDGLGNLARISQLGNGTTDVARTRTFTYDSLARLLCASNPENSSVQCSPSAVMAPYIAGTIRYGYDPNGNQTGRTDARGVVTAYGYDALNRLTSRIYSGLPASVPSTDASSFVYDVSTGPVVPNSLGRLVSEHTGPASAPTTQRTILAYDSMGRITQESQCITAVGCGAAPHQFQYMYDLAGNVTYSNNGVAAMGIGLSPTYDGVGRLTTVVSTWSDSSHPAILFAPPASGAQYGPSGLIGASLGLIYRGARPLYTQQRSYDTRFRINSETDTNLTATVPAKSSGAITIAGTERIPPASTQYSATASATILGSSDKSKPLPNPPNGCMVVGTQCYDAGGGALTIVTVRASNGQTAGTINYPFSYGAADTSTSIAGTLVNEINASSLSTGFSATQTGGTINLALNAASTFPITYLVGAGGGCSGAFQPCSFQPIPGTVGPVTAAGGSAGYDAGSITVYINGTWAGVTWQAGSSMQSIASQLSSVLQGSGLITAVSSGSTVTLTSILTGTSTNWPITCSVTDSAGQTPSFSAQCSGMSGGTDQAIIPLTRYSYSIPVGGYAANGNLLSVNDSAIGNWSYTYDSLNRLQTAQASANSQTGYAPYGGAKLTWAYDSFGNYKSETLSGNTQFAMPQPLPYSYTGTNTNRIDNFNYDAAGNQLSDPVSGLLNYYVYDAEGRLYSAGNGAVQYLYDAEGRRVGKLNGTTLTNQYLLGLGGEQVSELDGPGNWVHSNAYAGGQLLATYDKAGLHFQFADWLGSRRVQASVLGSADETCLSLPFGDMLQCSGVDATEQHFTGLERDQESGLDHAMARQYASTLGRWTSPDPYDGSMDIGNPQSLNRYNYVLNRPLRFTDPSGLSNCRDCGNGGGSVIVIVTLGLSWVFDEISNFFNHPTNNQNPKPRANAQPWDEHGTPHYGANIGAALGLPSTGGCEFGACGGGSDFMRGGSSDSFHAYHCSMFGPCYMLPRNGFPRRLFGTRWCGPGGAGAPVSDVDRACRAHDICFGFAGLDARANTDSSVHLSLAQAVVAQGCNQQLYNSVSQYPNEAGSSRIQWWLKYGTYVGVLAPGTGVQ